MLELAEPLSSAGYCGLCPEPRSNGRSTGPLGDKTPHDWAGDIATVIEHAGQAPVVIVGHAHGNWTPAPWRAIGPTWCARWCCWRAPAGKVPKGVDAVPIPAEVRAQIKRCEDTSLPDACAYTGCSSRPATTLSLGCWAGTLN